MDEIMNQAMDYFKNHNWQKAEELFLQISDQEQVAAYVRKCRLFRQFSVGNSVPYGSMDGKELTWRVLEERGNMRLLIANELVSFGSYQQQYIDTYWENSYLRKWLNQDFLKDAFSAEEQRTILSTRIETPANEVYFTNGGVKTMDKLFVLSKPELERFFPEDADRDLGTWWWIRTPGSSLLTTSIVYNDGSFYNVGVNVNSKTGGIRPAMWVLLKGH